MITIEDPSTLGPIIADLRIMNRLSQRQMCAQIPMHQARLSDWETGRAIPTLPYLVPALKVVGYRILIAPDFALIPHTDRRTAP